MKIFIKTTLSSAVTALLLAAICLAQTSQPGSSASQEPSVTANQPNGAAGSGASLLPAGSTLQAELIAPVDARKNKAGGEVLAKVTHDVKASGNVVIPKGSRVVGHVTEVKSRSKDQPSSKVGVVFDRVVLKNGGEVAVAMRIQAIGRALPAGEGELASGTEPPVWLPAAYWEGLDRLQRVERTTLAILPLPQVWHCQAKALWDCTG